MKTNQRQNSHKVFFPRYFLLSICRSSSSSSTTTRSSSTFKAFLQLSFSFISTVFGVAATTNTQFSKLLHLVTVSQMRIKSFTIFSPKNKCIINRAICATAVTDHSLRSSRVVFIIYFVFFFDFIYLLYLFPFFFIYNFFSVTLHSAHKNKAQTTGKNY